MYVSSSQCNQSVERRPLLPAATLAARGGSSVGGGVARLAPVHPVHPVRRVRPVRPVRRVRPVRPPAVSLVSLCPAVGKVITGLFDVIMGGGIPCDSVASCLEWVKCKAARYLIEKLDNEIEKVGTEICQYIGQEALHVCQHICKSPGVVGFGISGYCETGCKALVDLGVQECIKYVDSIVGAIPPAEDGCGVMAALKGDETSLTCWKCKAVKKGVDEIFTAMEAEADKACTILVDRLVGFAKTEFHVTIPDAFLEPAANACENLVADVLGTSKPPKTSIDYTCAAVKYLVDKAHAEVKHLEDEAIMQFCQSLEHRVQAWCPEVVPRPFTKYCSSIGGVAQGAVKKCVDLAHHVLDGSPMGPASFTYCTVVKAVASSIVQQAAHNICDLVGSLAETEMKKIPFFTKLQFPFDVSQPATHWCNNLLLGGSSPAPTHSTKTCHYVQEFASEVVQGAPKGIDKLCAYLSTKAHTLSPVGVSPATVRQYCETWIDDVYHGEGNAAVSAQSKKCKAVSHVATSVANEIASLEKTYLAPQCKTVISKLFKCTGKDDWVCQTLQLAGPAVKAQAEQACVDFATGTRTGVTAAELACAAVHGLADTVISDVRKLGGDACSALAHVFEAKCAQNIGGWAARTLGMSCADLAPVLAHKCEEAVTEFTTNRAQSPPSATSAYCVAVGTLSDVLVGKIHAFGVSACGEPPCKGAPGCADYADSEACRKQQHCAPAPTKKAGSDQEASPAPTCASSSAPCPPRCQQAPTCRWEPGSGASLDALLRKECGALPFFGAATCGAAAEAAASYCRNFLDCHLPSSGAPCHPTTPNAPWAHGGFYCETVVPPLVEKIMGYATKKLPGLCDAIPQFCAPLPKLDQAACQFLAPRAKDYCINSVHCHLGNAPCVPPAPPSSLSYLCKAVRALAPPAVERLTSYEGVVDATLQEECAHVLATVVDACDSLLGSGLCGSLKSIVTVCQGIDINGELAHALKSLTSGPHNSPMCAMMLAHGAPVAQYLLQDLPPYSKGMPTADRYCKAPHFKTLFSNSAAARKHCPPEVPCARPIPKEAWLAPGRIFAHAGTKEKHTAAPGTTKEDCLKKEPPSPHEAAQPRYITFDGHHCVYYHAAPCGPGSATTAPSPSSAPPGNVWYGPEAPYPCVSALGAKVLSACEAWGAEQDGLSERCAAAYATASQMTGAVRDVEGFAHHSVCARALQAAVNACGENADADAPCKALDQTHWMSKCKAYIDNHGAAPCGAAPSPPCADVRYLAEVTEADVVAWLRCTYCNPAGCKSPRQYCRKAVPASPASPASFRCAPCPHRCESCYSEDGVAPAACTACSPSHHFVPSAPTTCFGAPGCATAPTCAAPSCAPLPARHKVCAPRGAGSGARTASSAQSTPGGAPLSTSTITAWFGCATPPAPGCTKGQYATDGHGCAPCAIAEAPSHVCRAAPGAPSDPYVYGCPKMLTAPACTGAEKGWCTWAPAPPSASPQHCRKCYSPDGSAGGVVCTACAPGFDLDVDGTCAAVETPSCQGPAACAPKSAPACKRAPTCRWRAGTTTQRYRFATVPKLSKVLNKAFAATPGPNKKSCPLCTPSCSGGTYCAPSVPGYPEPYACSGKCAAPGNVARCAACVNENGQVSCTACAPNFAVNWSSNACGPAAPYAPVGVLTDATVASWFGCPRYKQGCFSDARPAPGPGPAPPNYAPTGYNAPGSPCAKLASAPACKAPCRWLRKEEVPAPSMFPALGTLSSGDVATWFGCPYCAPHCADGTFCMRTGARSVRGSTAFGSTFACSVARCVDGASGLVTAPCSAFAAAGPCNASPAAFGPAQHKCYAHPNSHVEGSCAQYRTEATCDANRPTLFHDPQRPEDTAFGSTPCVWAPTGAYGTRKCRWAPALKCNAPGVLKYTVPAIDTPQGGTVPAAPRNAPGYRHCTACASPDGTRSALVCTACAPHYHPYRNGCAPGSAPAAKWHLTSQKISGWLGCALCDPACPPGEYCARQADGQYACSASGCAPTLAGLGAPHAKRCRACFSKDGTTSELRCTACAPGPAQKQDGARVALRALSCAPGTAQKQDGARVALRALSYHAGPGGGCAPGARRPPLRVEPENVAHWAGCAFCSEPCAPGHFCSATPLGVVPYACSETTCRKALGDPYCKSCESNDGTLAQLRCTSCYKDNNGMPLRPDTQRGACVCVHPVPPSPTATANHCAPGQASAPVTVSGVLEQKIGSWFGCPDCRYAAPAPSVPPGTFSSYSSPGASCATSPGACGAPSCHGSFCATRPGPRKTTPFACTPAGTCGLLVPGCLSCYSTDGGATAPSIFCTQCANAAPAPVPGPACGPGGAAAAPVRTSGYRKPSADGKRCVPACAPSNKGHKDGGLFNASTVVQMLGCADCAHECAAPHYCRFAPSPQPHSTCAPCPSFYAPEWKNCTQCAEDKKLNQRTLESYVSCTACAPGYQLHATAPYCPPAAPTSSSPPWSYFSASNMNSWFHCAYCGPGANKGCPEGKMCAFCGPGSPQAPSCVARSSACSDKATEGDCGAGCVWNRPTPNPFNYEKGGCAPAPRKPGWPYYCAPAPTWKPYCNKLDSPSATCDTCVSASGVLNAPSPSSDLKCTKCTAKKNGKGNYRPSDDGKGCAPGPSLFGSPHAITKSKMAGWLGCQYCPEHAAPPGYFRKGKKCDAPAVKCSDQIEHCTSCVTYDGDHVKCLTCEGSAAGGYMLPNDDGTECVKPPKGWKKPKEGWASPNRMLEWIGIDPNTCSAGYPQMSSVCSKMFDSVFDDFCDETVPEFAAEPCAALAAACNVVPFIGEAACTAACVAAATVACNLLVYELGTVFNKWCTKMVNAGEKELVHLFCAGVGCGGTGCDGHPLTPGMRPPPYVPPPLCPPPPPSPLPLMPKLCEGWVGANMSHHQRAPCPPFKSGYTPRPDSHCAACDQDGACTACTAGYVPNLCWGKWCPKIPATTSAQGGASTATRMMHDARYCATVRDVGVDAVNAACPKHPKACTRFDDVHDPVAACAPGAPSSWCTGRNVCAPMLQLPTSADCVPCTPPPRPQPGVAWTPRAIEDATLCYSALPAWSNADKPVAYSRLAFPLGCSQYNTAPAFRQAQNICAGSAGCAPSIVGADEVCAHSLYSCEQKCHAADTCYAWSYNAQEGFCLLLDDLCKQAPGAAGPSPSDQWETYVVAREQRFRPRPKCPEGFDPFPGDCVLAAGTEFFHPHPISFSQAKQWATAAPSPFCDGACAAFSFAVHRDVERGSCQCASSKCKAPACTADSEPAEVPRAVHVGRHAAVGAAWRAWRALRGTGHCDVLRGLVVGGQAGCDREPYRARERHDVLRAPAADRLYVRTHVLRRRIFRAQRAVQLRTVRRSEVRRFANLLLGRRARSTEQRARLQSRPRAVPMVRRVRDFSGSRTALVRPKMEVLRAARAVHGVHESVLRRLYGVREDLFKFVFEDADEMLE